MNKKICISGYYGFNNFGDETILKILTQNLKSIDNSLEITVFSSNPEETAKSLGVKSIPSFNLKSILTELYKTNCLISGGGSLLQDVTSSKSLIYYLLVLILAKFFKKRIIIFAQGIGPIKNKILRNLTFLVLKKADYITVRDTNSLEMLDKKGIKADLCSDPVWNINSNENIQKNNKLGIQLREFYNINELFINKLALAINNNFSHREIVLLSLQNKLDLQILNKFKNKLSEINPSLNIRIEENNSNEKIIKEIASLQELIAMRYHANLVGIKNNVKILPIAYDIKVKTIADDFNIYCINPDNPEEINDKIKEFKLKEISYNNETINSKKFDFYKLYKHI